MGEPAATLDDTIALANSVLAKYGRDADKPSVALARYIIDNLAESQGCGMEPPEAFLFSDGSPGVSFGEDTMSATDARIVAAGFLRAAEQAEKLASK